MRRALQWIERHPTLVAALAAAWIVLRAGRWMLGAAWTARDWVPWDDAWPWVRGHWVVGVALAAGLFGIIFLIVRLVIIRIGRRDSAPPTARAPAAAPVDERLVPGDPLAAREP